MRGSTVTATLPLQNHRYLGRKETENTKLGTGLNFQQLPTNCHEKPRWDRPATTSK